MHLSLCHHDVWQFLIEHHEVQVWDGASDSCWSSQGLLMAPSRVKSAPDLERPPILLAYSATFSHPEFQESALHKGKKNNNQTTHYHPGVRNQALPSPLLSSLLHLTGALVWVQLFHVLAETQLLDTGMILFPLPKLNFVLVKYSLGYTGEVFCTLGVTGLI